jgi:hypothetical protein
MVVARLRSSILTLEQGRIPEVTLECVRKIRETLPRAKVSVEVEKPGREGLVELAAEADVVFFSRSWAEVLLTPLPREFHPDLSIFPSCGWRRQRILM